MKATYVAVFGARKPIASVTRRLYPPSPFLAMVFRARKMKKKNFISVSIFLSQMRKPRVIRTCSPSASFGSHLTILYSVYLNKLSMFVLLFQLAQARYSPRRLMTKIPIANGINNSYPF